MVLVCYFCNKSNVRARKLIDLRSKHTNTLICDFIKRFLGDFKSSRNIDDESNFMCIECIIQINKFDLLSQSAIEQEKKLCSLLMSTEESCNSEPIEVKTISEDSYNETGLKNEELNSEEEDQIEIDTEQDGNIVHPQKQTQKHPQYHVEKEEEEEEEEEDKERTTIDQDNSPKHLNENASISDSLNQQNFMGFTQSEEQQDIIVRRSVKLLKLRLRKRNDDSPNDPLSSNQTPINILETRNGKVLKIVKSAPSSSSSPADQSTADQSTAASTDVHKSPSTFISRNDLPKCDTCNYVFKTEKSLVRHRKLHERKCDECGIPVKGTKAMKAHKNWHKRYPGFICRICHFELSDADSMKAHRQLHENKSRLECVFCGKTFREMPHILKHVTTHSERNKLCELCGKAFITVNRLKAHINIHTNTRIYKCKICSKEFNANSNLSKHMKSHFDNRPYECSFCDMKFKHKCDRRVHERRHTNETKTEKCTFCSAAYEHRFHLKQHMERRHGAEVLSNK